MQKLRQAATIFIAFVAASLTGGLLLSTGVWVSARDSAGGISFLQFWLAASTAIMTLAAIPAAMLVTYAEALGRQSIALYLAGGGLIGMMILFAAEASEQGVAGHSFGAMMFFSALAGAGAGAVYWGVAGRRAGVWHPSDRAG